MPSKQRVAVRNAWRRGGRVAARWWRSRSGEGAPTSSDKQGSVHGGRLDQPHGFNDALAVAPRPVLVLTHGVSQDVCTEWLPDGATVCGLETPVEGEYATVVLAVRDRLWLRRAVTGLPELGRVSAVGCWLEESGGRPPVLVPRQEWPRLESLRVHCSASAHAMAEFTRPVPARAALVDFARHSTRQQKLMPGWPLLVVGRSHPELWPLADPTARVTFDVAESVGERVVPADMLLTRVSEPVDLPEYGMAHPVLNRSPVVVMAEAEPLWSDFDALSPAERQAYLERLGPMALGGIDEQVLNPIGFQREWKRPLESLVGGPPGGDTLVLEGGGRQRLIDARRGVTETDIRMLRPVRGLRVDWRGGPGPVAYARVVASLAMTGVPLVVDDVPSWAEPLLGEDLVRELRTRAELDDPLSREETSVRVRRAALRSHSTRTWRSSLATAHGVAANPQRQVSLLLPSRRPHMLEFALKQVGQQRGVDLELVLITHGFELGERAAKDLLAPYDFPVRFAVAGPELGFGDVLNVGAAHASGTLLNRMDDDDWYGPHFTEDLMLAHMYSSADVVGAAHEFFYVEALDETFRHRWPTEGYRDGFGGGTLFMSRGALDEMGGFRSIRKFEDAALRHVLRNSGASMFRAHGLNWVMRRAGDPEHVHTWEPTLEYFTDEQKVAARWDGFRPSRAMEHSPQG